MSLFKKKLHLYLTSVVLAFMIIGGNSIESSASGHAVMTAESSTTESGGGESGDINDFFVQIDDNGKLSTSMDDKDGISLWQFIFDNGKIIVLGISGVATIIFAIMLIINFAHISAAKGNPNELARAIKGVVWTLVAAAGCGATFIILALAWGFFR